MCPFELILLGMQVATEQDMLIRTPGPDPQAGLHGGRSSGPGLGPGSLPGAGAGFWGPRSDAHEAGGLTARAWDPYEHIMFVRIYFILHL